MVMDGEKEAFIELESTWVLLHDLPHSLNKLRENRRRLAVVRRLQETAAIGKFVTKGQPFLLYQSLPHTTK